ncbi:hypothetical protein LTR29_017921 [Friedmanniomyces endolithicus]|nr:hypothetical protein LTR29_017921 [Friedmanniomyces endolithicus]
MNSESYDDIFTRASEGQRNFIEVTMDHADIVLLPENQRGAIATRRLGGCSGVVILGRTAAIMAHIAPLPTGPTRGAQAPRRSGTADQTLSESEKHFTDILRHVENLYVVHRPHFPSEATIWGFYLAGAEGVTDDLRAIASRRFAALGLRGRHTYYQAYTSVNRRDEVRVGVQIDGAGSTSFYVETRHMESIRFPDPLPDPHASQRAGQPRQKNFLTMSARDPRFVQMVFGRAVAPDLTRFNGVTRWQSRLEEVQFSIPVLGVTYRQNQAEILNGAV